LSLQEKTFGKEKSNYGLLLERKKFGRDFPLVIQNITFREQTWDICFRLEVVVYTGGICLSLGGMHRWVNCYDHTEAKITYFVLLNRPTHFVVCVVQIESTLFLTSVKRQSTSEQVYSYPTHSNDPRSWNRTFVFRIWVGPVVWLQICIRTKILHILGIIPFPLCTFQYLKVVGGTL